MRLGSVWEAAEQEKARRSGRGTYHFTFDDSNRAMNEDELIELA